MHRTIMAALVASTVIGAGTAGAQSKGAWYHATGKVCSTVDVAAARAVQIKTDRYDGKTMISPDSAKIIALCAVPGQIGSGEMNVANGRTEYAIDIIPNQKKTHAKVIVDAKTGAVLSSKQFGGLRGIAGWVRESAEHKENAKP
ncbi:MAG: PepSY domain-containing protein [Gemmatimonadaceae bacterium]